MSFEHELQTISAIDAVRHELKKAEEKFPWWPTDPVHAAAIVAEEAGELVKAALQYIHEAGDPNEMFIEAAQTGAMAIRFLRAIGGLEFPDVKRKEEP